MLSKVLLFIGIGFLSYSLLVHTVSNIEDNLAMYKLGTYALEVQQVQRQFGHYVVSGTYGQFVRRNHYELRPDGHFYKNGKQIR